MSSEQDKHSLQHEAEHAKPRKKVSVVGYLAILFAVAFLLLLLSYFMQQRANTDAMDDLKQTSVSAYQSLENLITERDALQAQVDDLEEELEQTQRELDGAWTTVANLSDWQEHLIRAMDLFWQIDEAYVRGRYTLCRQLIEEMEDVSAGSALKEYLPTESTTDNDRFSPADRYQEIYDALY